jgi:hypothetical protein
MWLVTLYVAVTNQNQPPYKGVLPFCAKLIGDYHIELVLHTRDHTFMCIIHIEPQPAEVGCRVKFLAMGGH